MLGLLVFSGLVRGQDIRAQMHRIDSVKATAPDKDLAFLSQVTKGATVVGLGEATHGTSEFCTMKHRIFRYLVEHEGFTVFGLEASMPDCLAMDDFVTTGKGDPAQAVKNQGFWTWSTQEVLDLIKWMRAYNLDPKHGSKLHVVGFDMQSQVSGTLYFERKEKELTGDTDSAFWESVSYDPLTPDLRTATTTKMDELIEKIEKQLGSEEARRARFVKRVYFQSERNTWTARLRMLQSAVLPTMQETFADSQKIIDDLKLQSSDAYDGLKFLDEHKNKLVDPKPEEKSALIANLSKWSMAIRNISSKDKSVVERLGRQASLLDFIGFALADPSEKGTTFFESNSFRDRCMAENLVEVSKSLFPSQKVFAWAHNGHIMRSVMPNVAQSMGKFLDQSLGSRYCPIGFVFGSGSFQAINANRKLTVHEVKQPEKDSFDEQLSKMGQSAFFISTNLLKEKVNSRSIGALYDPKFADRYVMSYSPAEAFSGLIFISQTTPTHLLP